MSKEINDFDKSLEKAIRLGWIEKLPGGKFRLTEKGKREVEDRILPSVGMTPKQFSTIDGLKETFIRMDKRDSIKKDMESKGDLE